MILPRSSGVERCINMYQGWKSRVYSGADPVRVCSPQPESPRNRYGVEYLSLGTTKVMSVQMDVDNT